MRAIRIIVFCGAVVFSFSVNAIDFSRVNISWQYDPAAEIELADRVIQNGNMLSVFLRFRYDTTFQWSMKYLLQTGYKTEKHVDLTSYTLDTLQSIDGRIVLRLNFNKPEENLLVLKISNGDVSYYYDIQLRNGSLAHSSIILQGQNGLPIFEKYLNTSNFQWGGSNRYLATEYSDRFGPADPPMADMKPLAPSILPDSTFWLLDNESIKNNYFYIVRSDSNALSGATILKVSPYYPEFKLLGELSTSMEYILNEAERKGIRNSTNVKDSFDSFWINTFTTKFRARNAIRNYFNWVEQANKRFTDFKQGWKTDRGMIYIVYGVPDEVYRTDAEEEWFYDEGPFFEYTIISTFFSSRTYALRRQMGHEQSWYEFIAAIRRGNQ